MNNSDKSIFRFEKFIVNQVSFINDIETNTLNIDISPSGVIQGRTFDLSLILTITDPSGKLQIIIDCTGVFSFDFIINKDEIPDYCIYNAPAIIFPYIRAYISTLTTLSGQSIITLPTINFSQHDKLFKENIIIK